MKYSEAKPGRIFVIRLENGDILHTCIEKFAREHNITAAALLAVGGADKNSKLVCGPITQKNGKIKPLETVLKDIHEINGTGTLFPNAAGKPVLHMHLGCGRKKDTITGCVRPGVKVWQIMEIVLWELTGCTAVRRLEQATGLELMQPE
ncbi:MAG TPA: PPC domain-containing DNA-binding protein [Spirochaetota bacterium]|nr:PPC domain-containing DNA-binding protein [Spirochaetota bacterium]